MAVFGKNFQVSIDGASHGEGVDTYINGCPEGDQMSHYHVNAATGFSVYRHLHDSETFDHLPGNH